MVIVSKNHGVLYFEYFSVYHTASMKSWNKVKVIQDAYATVGQ